MQNQNFGAQNQNAGAQAQNNSGNTNRVVVPEAKGALNQMKYEIANELGINLKKGYNGDLPSRQAGYIGGYMTKRLVEQAERAMSNQG
ncbi:MAG: alpha/beta-type small acid-soluble spore protein [Clostridia bacterium]|nr:alpha/beta-type small acid-soluble spore protein [Clostridia bacterium]